MVLANVLMAVGALVWLVGELYGVHRKGPDDTTSEAVWHAQALPYVGPVVRVLVGVFVLSLAGHFWAGTALLP